MIKHSNIDIIGFPEEKEKKTENLSEEIIPENFPNLGKGTYPHPGGAENPKSTKADPHQDVQ